VEEAYTRMHNQLSSFDVFIHRKSKVVASLGVGDFHSLFAKDD
jgi:hypothetical protein